MTIQKQQVIEFYIPLIKSLLSQNANGVLPECFEALDIAISALSKDIEENKNEAT